MSRDWDIILYRSQLPPQKKKLVELQKRSSKFLCMYNEAVERYNALRSDYDRKCMEVIEMKRGVSHGNNSQIVKRLAEQVAVANNKLMEHGLL